MNYVKWGVLGAAAALVSDIAAGLSFTAGLPLIAQKGIKYGVAGAFTAVAHKFLVPSAG